MIELLNDKDGEVRFYSARALERLAGNNMGKSPEQWRSQKYVDTLDLWQNWLKEKKDRYPDGPMSPTPMPSTAPLMQKARS